MALSLRPQTMVTFVSISRVVLESLILSLSPKGGDVTSGWRVALFLLLLFNGFFSDLGAAQRFFSVGNNKLPTAAEDILP